MSNIAAAIQAAKDNAANAVPANVGANDNQHLTVVQPGRKLTMDDLKVGSMAVDLFLKVKEFGLLFGTDTTLVTEPITVEIDMTAVTPYKAVKYSNPAIYKKSYDGVTVGGTTQSWTAALAEAARIDPKAREYRSADIPMNVITDIIGSKGKVVVEAGKKLGHSLSTTNWKNYVEFYNEVEKAGLTNSTVLVEVGFEPRTNGANQRWGVLTFELKGEAADVD